MASSNDGSGSRKHANVTLAKYVGTLLLGGVLGVAGTTSLVSTTLTDGTTVVRVDRQIIYSGSSLNITGTLTEDDRVGNGTQTGWVLQNPYPEDILVKGVTLYVITAGETTKVDVSRGTGSIVTGINAATGTTLANNLTLTAGLYNLTGSLLLPSTAKNFILDKNGGTNDYIIIASTSPEAGSGTVIKYHIDGRQLE